MAEWGWRVMTDGYMGAKSEDIGYRSKKYTPCLCGPRAKLVSSYVSHAAAEREGVGYRPPAHLFFVYILLTLLYFHCTYFHVHIHYTY